MSMQEFPVYYAVVEKATGEAVSFGRNVGDVVPDHLEKIEVDGPPNGRLWNPALRKYDPYPIPQPTPLEKGKAAYAIATTVAQKLDAIADALELR